MVWGTTCDTPWDNIVILADRDMLDVIQDYVVKWKMKFNGMTNKVMVVGKVEGV